MMVFLDFQYVLVARPLLLCVKKYYIYYSQHPILLQLRIGIIFASRYLELWTVTLRGGK